MPNGGRPDQKQQEQENDNSTVNPAVYQMQAFLMDTNTDTTETTDTQTTEKAAAKESKPEMISR